MLGDKKMREVRLTDNPFRYIEFEAKFKEHMKQKIAEACLPDYYQKNAEHLADEMLKAFMQRFTTAVSVVSTDDYDFLWGYCWNAADAAILSWIDVVEARNTELCYPTLWNV